MLQELDREELLAKCSEHIELKTDNARAACVLLENMGFTNFKVIDKDTIHIFERLQDGGEIAACLANHQIKILGLTVQNEALEEYYLNLTGGAKHV